MMYLPGQRGASARRMPLVRLRDRDYTPQIDRPIDLRFAAWALLLFAVVAGFSWLVDGKIGFGIDIGLLMGLFIVRD